MTRHIEYTIEECSSGMDVKDYLKAHRFSAQIISNLKHVEDGILHNGHRAYVTEVLKPGDTIAVNIHEDVSSEKIPPVRMELDILYEDEDLVIVNKPADMPVHPSLNNYENTLANGLAFYYEAKNEKFVFRCMNRLDRNTTGAVLVAKNALSGAILSQMIRDRIIEKEYVAIVEGNIEKDFVVDAPIGRLEGSSIERCVDELRGERAVTHARIIKCERDYTVVSCSLETGRTHQIRVHMAHIGHPLIGDGLYNPKYKDSEYDPSKHRQLLHCHRLRFEHPILNKEILVEAPFPNDMSQAVNKEI